MVQRVVSTRCFQRLATTDRPIVPYISGVASFIHEHKTSYFLQKLKAPCPERKRSHTIMEMFSFYARGMCRLSCSVSLELAVNILWLFNNSLLLYIFRINSFQKWRLTVRCCLLCLTNNALNRYVGVYYIEYYNKWGGLLFYVSSCLSQGTICLCYYKWTDIPL